MLPMRRRFKNSLLVLLSVPLMLGSSTDKQTHSLTVMGDSLACQMGPSLTKKTFCHVGSRTEFWNKRLKDIPKDSGPVVIFLGTNHYLDTTSPDIQPIIDWVGQRTCVWVGPTLVNGKRRLIESMLRDSLSKTNCRYVSLHNDSVKLSDGIHPTKDSAEKIVAQVKQML